METFLMVTGPKTDHLGTEQGDHWLVITVGTLVAAIAIPLLSAAWHRLLTREVVLLAVGSALGLTAIDILFVLRGAIPPIYLGDAALEVLLLFGWCAAAVISQKKQLAASSGGAHGPEKAPLPY
jgi:hypothetical protein